VRQIIEAGRIATLEWDVDGDTFDWNTAHFRLLGLSPDEATPSYELWMARMHPDDRTRVAELLAERIRIGGEFELEFRVLGAGDTPRWVEARGRVDREDSATRCQTVLLDIHERKRAEDVLRQNAALFATIIEQAPGGVYVVDGALRIQAVNSEALPVFSNVSPLLGRDLADAMVTLWGPVVGRQCVEIFRQTLDTGERYVSPRFSELRVDIGVEQAYEWETQRVTLPDGQHGVVCYFDNVTERERRAEALRASEERVRIATHATGVGIWEWNLRTNRVHWDAQLFEIYGMSPTADGTVSYEDWRDQVFPDDVADAESSLQATIRDRTRGVREFRIRRLCDAEVRVIQAVETVRTDVHGNAAFVVGTNLDVTARKRDEQALLDADRHKDEFLATLAHELRNPLAPVRNAVHVLQLHAETQPELRWAAGIIDRQVQQMTRLIDDLMDVSRISQGKLELRREHVALVSVVQNAIETSRPLLDAGGHALDVALPAADVIVHADPTRLAQVVSNLMNNAAKYTPSGGSISLRTAVEREVVVIRVRDTGIGIPQESLPEIFGMFSQVQDALSRSNGGLGIGLFLVRRLIEMHGGTVEAFSDGIGAGSEFVVTLPIVTSLRAMPDTAEPAASAAMTASPLRIAVVDDNRDAATSLAMLLELMGNTARIALDGAAALALAEEFRPDVVLLDIGLPGLNGYAVARAIRATEWGRSTLLVAVTGWGQSGDRERATDAGFDHHLVKPVDPHALMTLIATAGAPRD
jgi:PAS domain S-box-containing protein